MNNFLPNNYKIPEESNYMRFGQGENTFRVLSSAIVGMEYWKTTKDDSGKPIRRPVRVKQGVTVDMSELETDPKTHELVMPKHFWAFIVWNRNAEKVQILEITQSGIRKKIMALTNSKSWGDPKEYDITITREGEGWDTEYSVMPNPKEKIDAGIVRLAKDMNIDINMLFEGKDPFKQEQDKEKIEPNDIPDNLEEK